MEVKHDKENQEFTIDFGPDSAELAYSLPADGVIAFTHTYVPESARGKGISKLLIESAFDYAEKSNLKVIPECEAVQVYLKRHPELVRLTK